MNIFEAKKLHREMNCRSAQYDATLNKLNKCNIAVGTELFAFRLNRGRWAQTFFIKT